MKISISEARQKLPELVRQVKADSNLRVLITVHGDVTAELRSHFPDPLPGAAARKLRELMSELPPRRGREGSVSERVNEALYGKPSE